MDDLKREMVEALARWVIGITKKELANAEEIAALADVAKVVMDYDSGLSGDVR